MLAPCNGRSMQWRGDRVEVLRADRLANQFRDGTGELLKEAAQVLDAPVILQLPGRLGHNMPQHHHPSRFRDRLPCRPPYRLEHPVCESIKRQHFSPVGTVCPEDRPFHLEAGLFRHEQNQARPINRILGQSRLNRVDTNVRLSGTGPTDEESNTHDPTVVTMVPGRCPPRRLGRNRAPGHGVGACSISRGDPGRGNWCRRNGDRRNGCRCCGR